MLPIEESDTTTPILIEASKELSDRELIEAIYASQLRVEAAVTDALSGMVPMLEAVKTKGIMGLMTLGK